MKMSTRQAEKKTAAAAKSTPDAAFRAANVQRIAFASSIAGYLAEIGARQSRHFPASRAHDRTGTLSRARIGAPQAGHREPGKTIDLPRGIR